MTTATTPLSYRIGPALVVLSLALAIWTWFVEPGRTLALALTAGLLLIMLVAAFMFRRSARGDASRRAADSIAAAIVFAGVMISASLALKLGGALGLLDHASDLSQRFLMIVLGVFFVFTGNALPKTLAPLTATCDGARTQAFQRFAGWTWVLTGLVFALSWLVLPEPIAQPVSLVALLGGMSIVIIQIVRLRRTRSSEA
jgi:hypothetical protein